ncbi:ornithine carbamoyltransferase [bacterium]|nr:ornithine carbamoyltransferase [bacterium]
MKKDFVSISDLTRADVERILDLATRLKDRQAIDRKLKGKTLALVFEKPSLRTRVTFEVGMTQLGGHAVYLSQSDIGPGKRESVSDIARNLERWVDGIAARTFRHGTVVELAANGSIPVINALSDEEHPCQALADFLTIREKKGDLASVRLAYLGDVNNVCRSLVMLASLTGTSMVVGTPAAALQSPATVSGEGEEASAFASALRRVEVRTDVDPKEVVKDADVIYTDIWVSMGEEDRAEEKVRDLRAYQVNSEVLEAAKKDVIFMHCLPAKRNQEVTDEVLDGPHSVVFDQAENRLHAQKALLLLLLGGDVESIQR